MSDLWAALGLVMVIEGALYALFPSAMKQMMATVLPQPDDMLRRIGLAAAVFGIFVVWLARG